MSEIERAQTKLACVIEAGKLKQNPNTSEEYKNKSMVDIAKEMEAFVLSE